MLRRLIPLTILCAAVLATGPAWATHKHKSFSRDRDNHPFVGLVILDVQGIPSRRCNGTLIAPDVLLTTGRCVDGTTGARVWFDERVTDPAFPFDGAASTSGFGYSHPQFDASTGAFNIGVVILDRPVALDRYAELPAVGALDELRGRHGWRHWRKHSFDRVAYGLRKHSNRLKHNRKRYVAHSRVKGFRYRRDFDNYVKLRSWGRINRRGKCVGVSGDEGAPVFQAGSDTVVVGVTTRVKSHTRGKRCRATAVAWRTDTEATQLFTDTFLNPFPAPPPSPPFPGGDEPPPSPPFPGGDEPPPSPPFPGGDEPPPSPPFPGSGSEPHPADPFPGTGNPPPASPPFPTPPPSPPFPGG